MQDEGLDALSRAPGLCVDSEDGGVYRVRWFCSRYAMTGVRHIWGGMCSVDSSVDNILLVAFWVLACSTGTW